MPWLEINLMTERLKFVQDALSVRNTMAVELVVSALRMAREAPHPAPGVIFHRTAAVNTRQRRRAPNSLRMARTRSLNRGKLSHSLESDAPFC